MNKNILNAPENVRQTSFNEVIWVIIRSNVKAVFSHIFIFELQIQTNVVPNACATNPSLTETCYDDIFGYR